jgi:hypothetical protein
VLWGTRSQEIDFCSPTLEAAFSPSFDDVEDLCYAEASSGGRTRAGFSNGVPEVVRVRTERGTHRRADRLRVRGQFRGGMDAAA